MSPEPCIVALDVGSKRIGVAEARVDGIQARPLLTIKRKGVLSDVAALLKGLAERSLQAQAFVVGLPLDEEGQEQRSTKLARQVGEALGLATGLPVHLVDEAYSTLEAERWLRAQGVPQKRWANVIDETAAAVILQDWLDARP